MYKRNKKGQFFKGNIPWSKSQKGISLNNGKTHFKKGFKPWNHGLKGIQKGYWKGKKMSKEACSKMKKADRELTSGKNHYNWQGGITPISFKIRNSIEYKLWRNSVFERDNYTCIWCGERGGKLNADHIKPFAIYPELRFAIDNGRTLCRKCHETTLTFGGRIKYGQIT